MFQREFYGINPVIVFQEPEGTPKAYVHVPSDYESDGDEAFPELEVPVSIILLQEMSEVSRENIDLKRLKTMLKMRYILLIDYNAANFLFTFP